MNNSVLTIIFAVILSAGLIVTLRVMTADAESGQTFWKAAFFYFTVVLIFFSWFILRIYAMLKIMLNRYEGLERLLFDVRDDTKSFFKEKRETPRLHGEIKARMITEGFAGKIELINLSYDGALLSSSENLEPGRLASLKIFLPLFPQPIEAKVRVVRSVARAGTKNPPIFDIAVEFTAISNIDREKLVETMDVLLEKQTGKA